MHVYEVVSKYDPEEKHVVIARSKGNAVRTLILELNKQKGFDFYSTDDFVVQRLIEPSSYSEEAVIN